MNSYNENNNIIPVYLEKNIFTNLYMAASDILTGHPDMSCVLKYVINDDGKYKVTGACLYTQFPHKHLSDFINSFYPVSPGEEYRIYILIKEQESVKARSEVAKVALSKVKDITYEAKKRANIYNELVSTIG